PALDDKSLKEKRAEMKTRLENERGNPDSFLSRLANTAFFAGHPYLNRPDGSLESVEKLDRTTIENALKAALRSGRVLLVAVSPMEHSRTRELLEKRFSWIAADDS